MRTVEKLIDNGVRRYGRFATRPVVVNPLDELSGVRRALRRWRLKEWVGFMVTHPAWALSCIMQDAKYLASSELFVRDKQRDVLHAHESVAPPGFLSLPDDLLDSTGRFHRKGYELSFEFSGTEGRHRLRFNMAASKSAPSITGELEIDGGGASAPLSVSSKLPGGSMYTYKQIFPVEGLLRVGDEEITYDATRDVAIIDEHKSFLPYRTKWLWGTFAMHTDDGLVGANFADRTELPGQEEESGLWFPGTCEPLADISFRPESADPLAAWKIASDDGRLDVTFEPEGRKEVKRQLGVFAVDYFTLYGTYHGVVQSADKAYDVDGVPGVCESMDARL